MSIGLEAGRFNDQGLELSLSRDTTTAKPQTATSFCTALPAGQSPRLSVLARHTSYVNSEARPLISSTAKGAGGEEKQN